MISETAPEPPSATDALLRLFLTRAPTSLALFDREMRYLLYTQRWVETLPVGVDPLSGRSHADVLPGLLHTWQEAHQRALLGESVNSEADAYQHPDGSQRILSWEIHPWTSADGQVGGSVVTFEDITHHLHIETKLRREMESATATNMAKARLLVSTSYEVRAAMNSIIGMAHLCLRSNTSQKSKQHLQTIISEANLLTSSFNDILDLSKVETGNLQLESSEFNLGKVLNDLAHSIGLKAEEKGVEFVYQLPPTPPPPMVGDAERLRQVLTKLCENAVTLTEQGEVELSIDTLDREAERVTLEFSIRDTSPAFSAEERETLMAPFAPGECAGNSVLAKTRMGISICKSVVALMNGQMRVDSEPGQGNVFSFTAQFAVQSQARVEDESPPNTLMGARVLVVDDHRLARKTMARLLKSFDFDVAVAESGAQAIEMTEEACDRERPFQFVFMDYLMPGMNGLETTARLKERVNHKAPPKVILMTGRPMEDKKKEMENSPLDGYISKPFTPSLIFYAMLDAATAWPTADAAGKVENTKAPYLIGTRVLLVEDDEINQEIVHEILGDVGVKVDLANNGQEGLDCLEVRTYDAVLMDIQMPVMDGYEATCRIRGDERFVDLPIIALTASAMTLDRHASLEVGMNAHVAKPINPDELFSVLAEWIEPRKEATDENVSEDSTSVADPFGNVDLASPAPVDPVPIADPFNESDLEPLPHSPPEPEPENDTPLEFESLDADKGISLMGGNEKLFRRVLQKFATNQAATDREIRAALSMNDLQTALRLVHTLKGLSGNIGADGLASRVIELEDVMKSGETDDFNIEIGRVSGELQRVVREISTLELECPALPS